MNHFQDRFDEQSMTRINLKSDGAILLGNHVSADGFAWEYPIRVQTHIHKDHMSDFDTSKANQIILMSQQTKELLNAQYNADLPHRSNIKDISDKTPYKIDGDQIELLSSNHMLGCTQVKVTCQDGYRVGYSSDFFWPLEEVIQVDEIMLDSTYGDPLRTRHYNQSQVEEQLDSIIAAKIKKGKATAIIGHQGRLQYSMCLLSTSVACPVICSPKAFSLIEVYRKYGYSIAPVIKSDTAEALNILRNHELCLTFMTFHERRHLPWVERMSKVTLSAHMSGQDRPVLRYDNDDYCIALTDHADFQGTIEYVRATNAGIVWTDPRSGNAEALAQSISKLLGIQSYVAPVIKTLAWG